MRVVDLFAGCGGLSLGFQDSLKRADHILEWNDLETYIFYLEREQQFEILSVSVRSQIKKAVKLYTACIKAMEKRDLQMRVSVK